MGQDDDGVHSQARDDVRFCTGVGHSREMTRSQVSFVNNRCGRPSRVGAHLPRVAFAQQARAACNGDLVEKECAGEDRPRGGNEGKCPTA